MSICKKNDSPYYYTRFSICGIRIQESTRATSKTEAQQYEEKRRREVREQVLLGNKPKKTWVEAKARWLSEMQHKRSIKEDISHFDWLEKHLDHYFLEDITKTVIESIAKQKESEGVSNATVNRVLALIRSVLNRAWKHWEWINKVPVFPMRKENNARVRWLTREEANKLLFHLPPHLKAMARFTLATGLRAKNVSYLEWENVDIVNRHVIITPEKNKTKRHLGIPLNQEAVDVLQEQVGKHHKYVFVYGSNQ